MSERRFGKDSFTAMGFKISQLYLWPRGRGRLYLVGTIMALLATILFVADAFMGGATMVTSGSLSESHVLFGEDCATCHAPFESVSNAKCESCHEKSGAPMDQYGYQRHYLYRSTDFDRSAASSLETTCASCHQEHKGPEAPIQRVADAQCQTCHEYDSFESGHPEFAFVSDAEPDRANLAFTHVFHTREVQAEYELLGYRELDDVEDACLHCHVPREDGKSFGPLIFEQQCDACHFKASTRTAWLPIRSATAPGVLTLDAIRGQFSPASLWASYWDPNEFEVAGREMRKSPIFHADPWVMENLARIRAELYPGAELAQLLQSSAVLSGGIDGGVHDEAVATLRAGVRALRGNPSSDVQGELNALDDLLDEVEARMDEPYASRDETRFFVRTADAAGGALSQGADTAAFEAVIDGLTAECQSCHIVSQATIVRVQKDQRTLIRSEFDHRAHVIHARCLDCHTSIPVRDFVFGNEDPAPDADRAGIQNLPSVDSCRTCHSDGGASDRCTSCHVFHPDRTQRSNMSRAHR